MHTMVWVLLLLDVAVICLHIFLRHKLGFFDLDKEGNLASLYSGFKLWFAGTIAILYAMILYRLSRKRRMIFLWALLGGGLLYIGLDDMFVLHERFGFVMNNILGTGGFYGESFNWLFYFAPLVLAALYIFWHVIRSLWKESRAVALWLLAGIGLWVAAIGSEFLGRSMIMDTVVNVPLYHSLIVIEESLEFVGATFITFAVFIATKTLMRRVVTVAERVDQ